MKRLTAFWLSACFLCTISVQAQSFIPERDSSDISLFEYVTKIPKRNNVFNLDLEMHASFNTFFTGHKLDEAAFREAVRKERAYELAFEGHRRLDLVRWGIYYKTIQETSNKLSNWYSSANYVVAQYTEEGKHELMPIPQREMDLCPQFKQNPKW